MKRGELWWVALSDKRPVVLLSDGADKKFCAVQIVPPATATEKLGFVLMSGEQAADANERCRIIEAAGPHVRAIGIEVFLGTQEGLATEGVVRVALPRSGKIFCTWTLSLGWIDLIQRIGVLSPSKQNELDVALELSGAAKL